jgi:chemotaxis protein MotB
MEPQVRIPRRKKGGEDHGGSHGSWKVAYADFVTAMMAFFLLMWLLNMSSQEQRVKLSYYFKYFSLFEKGGTSMLQLSDDAMQSIANIETGEGGKDGKEASGADTPPGEPIKEAEKEVEVEEVVVEVKKEDLQERLKKLIEMKLADVKSQVLVDLFEGGVRVQLMDNDGALMFPVGSVSLSPKAKEILKVITENIRGVAGKVAIEGHTDARPYPSQEYTNWELSTERASAARKEMDRDGLDVKRIIRITGYADTEPLIKEDPFDAKNRRISILIYSDISEKKIKEPSSHSIPPRKDIINLEEAFKLNPPKTQ